MFRYFKNIWILFKLLNLFRCILLHISSCRCFYYISSTRENPSILCPLVGILSPFYVSILQEPFFLSCPLYRVYFTHLPSILPSILPAFLPSILPSMMPCSIDSRRSSANNSFNASHIFDPSFSLISLPSSGLVPACGCYTLYSFIQKYLINCLYIIIRCTLSDHIIDLFD